MIKNNIKIKTVEIKNFRSIKHSKIEFKNLNIFVGLNDAGKSNYLKALNLFFNNETDYGKSFDFETDFSNYYEKYSKKAKIVEIIVTFEFPQQYNGGNCFSWKKTWNMYGFMQDSMYPENNKNGKLPPRAKISAALHYVKYRYIPAVKSQEVYKGLMKDLYYAITNSSVAAMKKSIKGFANEIINTTIEVSEKIKNNINIESQISVPHDPIDLFTSLIIDTKVDNTNFKIPLNFRGDGIQVIHIPYILEYVDDTENTSSEKGKPRKNVLWGFEEPENGLEITKAMELANKFMNFSNDIQIVLTTHSPVFFQKNYSNDSKVFYVNQSNKGTTIADDNKGNLDKGLGLLEFISPIVKEEIEKYNNNSIPSNKDCILVEGITDKDYLELAINLYSTKLKRLIDNKELMIYASKTDGGVDNVCNYAKVRAYIDKNHKTLILFDNDRAGKEGRRKLNNEDSIKSARIKILKLDPDDKIKQYFKSNIVFCYGIEHLLSDEFWKEINQKGCLVENRDNDHCIGSLCEDTTLSYSDAVKKVKRENLKIFYSVKDDKKKKVVKLLQNKEKDLQMKILSGLKKTITSIESYFCKE